MPASGRQGRCRFVPALLVLALLTWTTSGCDDAEPAAPARPTLRVATAIAPLSVPLAEEYQRRLPHLDVQQVTSVDSYTVIDALQRGTADVGLALADAAFAAYYGGPGVAPDTTPTSSLIRGVSLLPPLSAYVIVRADSGIHTIADLQGRNVAVGAPTASSSNLAYRVLEAFEVKAHIMNMTTRAEASEGLRNKTIDAAFFPGYVYPDQVVYAAIKEGAYLIPISGPPLERLRWNNPFVRVATIPRDIYPGQNQMIPTVGIDMVVLCRRDLDEAIVHDVTAQLFNAYPKLSGVEATLKFLNIDEAPATPVPLHPGAARYFRERELAR
jgi:uncharacterized protein